MPNLIALVGRDAFDALVREHGRIEPGANVPIDRYLSTHEALDALDVGGELWLVTVRPDPVRLWVLAVLRAPDKRADGWYAESNRVSVTDITELVGELRFTSGRGLPPEPERLAMSLLTPRTLTDDDAVRLRARAEPSPGAAYHAAVIATLEPARTPKSQAPSDRTGEPRPWREALASIDVWRTLGEPARARAAEELCRELTAAGRRFRAAGVACGVDRLATVIHDDSGSELVVVPGGVYAKGFTTDDLLALWRATGTADEVVEELRGTLASLRPPRVTVVRPFLLGRALVDAASLREAAGVAPHHRDGEVGGALAALEALGWRLPSSAEWEWIAREGGAVRFVGVPRDQHPLRPSRVPPALGENGWGLRGLLNEANQVQGGRTRMGHTWWQWEAEAAGLHVAMERPGEGGALRLALDLPGAPAPPPVAWDWSTTCAETARALLGSHGADREAAVHALRELTAAWTPDAAEALMHAPDLVPAAEAALASLAVGLGGPKHLAELLVALAGLAERGAEALVRRAVPVLVGHLAASDERVRVAAWLAWGHASDGGDLDAIGPHLASEGEPAAVASALLALARVGRAAGDARASAVATREIAARLSHGHALVAGAAAVAAAELAVAAGRPLDEALVAALAKATALGRPERLPWYGGRLGERAYALVHAGGPEALDLVAVSLARGEPTREGWERALDLTFGPAPDPFAKAPVRDAAQLTPAQRQVAEALSRPGVAPLDHAVAFAPRGLPADLEDRRIWLGLEPPLAMESVTVDGLPYWRWAQGQLRSRTWTPAEWQVASERALGALSPFDRLALGLEVGRYDLWESGERTFGVSLPSVDVLAREAAAVDGARARAVIRRRLASFAPQAWSRRASHVHRTALTAWVATLAEGEALPADLVALIAPAWGYPRAIYDAADPIALERHLVAWFDERLERAFGEQGASIWLAWDLGLEVLAVLPTDALARRTLAVGLAAGGWKNASDAMERLAEAHLALRPALAEFRAAEPIAGHGEAKALARRLVGRA